MSKRSRKRRRRERAREQLQLVCVERNDWRSIYRVHAQRLGGDRPACGLPPPPPYHHAPVRTGCGFEAVLAALDSGWQTATAALMSDVRPEAPKSDAPDPPGTVVDDEPWWWKVCGFCE